MAIAPQGPSTSEASPGSWRETLFGAAVAAANGEPAWSREPDGGPGWRTQVRRIELGAAWLGLPANRRTAERVAHWLAIPLEIELEAQQLYWRAGFRNRGRGVAMVLQAIPVSPAPWRGLVAVGALTGVVGQPWAVDPRGTLLPLFRT